jgi:hypothetical protein
MTLPYRPGLDSRHEYRITCVLLAIPCAVGPSTVEADRPPVGKVERPAGRTTLTAGGRSARLARADCGRDGSAQPPTHSLGCTDLGHPGAKGPAGGAGTATGHLGAVPGGAGVRPPSPAAVDPGGRLAAGLVASPGRGALGRRRPLGVRGARQPPGVGACRSAAAAERRPCALAAARAARLSGRLEGVQKVLTDRRQPACPVSGPA